MDVKAWRDSMAVCFSSYWCTSSVITTLIIEKKHYMHKILVYRQYEWVWLSQLEQTEVRHISSMSTKNWCSKSLGSIFHMFNLTENVKPQLKCGHRFWMNILLFLSVHTLLHNRKLYFLSVWILWKGAGGICRENTVLHQGLTVPLKQTD